MVAVPDRVAGVGAPVVEGLDKVEEHEQVFETEEKHNYCAET